MRLCDALREKQMDVRLRDRYMAEGSMCAEDVEKYLSNLEDDSGNYIDLGSYGFVLKKQEGILE